MIIKYSDNNENRIYWQHRKGEEWRTAELDELIEAYERRTEPGDLISSSLTKSDMISKQKVKYKLTALVNEIEEIFANIRECEGDESVCGLCEYDGAYIGQSGDWCNECPGFEKDNCFKLKDKYRAEWESIDE